MSEFVPFPKMARLSRECIITEKIDGTNACVYVGEDGTVLAGKRTSWITPERDNFGFAAWVRDNEEQLRWLGPGRHFGEWWGSGIQRRYGLKPGERRFSLFNTTKFAEVGAPLLPKQRHAPPCCHVVPVVYQGIFSVGAVEESVEALRVGGSLASPGFMNPEGIIVFHTAAGVAFKKTIEDDKVPKSLSREAA